MANLRNIVIAGIVVAIVATLLVLNRPVETTTVIKEVPVDRPVGAVANPDIMSPYFSYGGVRHFGGRSTSLVAATTTVCAIQAPAATSTLTHGSLTLSVSSTTSGTARISKAATAYATTTLLGEIAFAASTPVDLVASTTPTAYKANLFGPNQWIVFSMQGGTGTFSPTGSCAATFVEL